MFRYVFHTEGAEPITFDIDETQALPDRDPSGELPAWLRLSEHKCEVCPLANDARRSCPAALAARPVIESFSGHISFETLRVEVHMDQFQLFGEVPAQQAVRSLLGLLFSLSACPVLSKLRPMARYHLPFGSREHTEFRFLGMYLIAQRLRAQAGLEPDWKLDGLLDLFQQIHAVNRMLAERLRDATTQDAALNSLVILDHMATSAEVSLNRRLEKLQALFGQYLT